MELSFAEPSRLEVVQFYFTLPLESGLSWNDSVRVKMSPNLVIFRLVQWKPQADFDKLERSRGFSGNQANSIEISTKRKSFLYFLITSRQPDFATKIVVMAFQSWTSPCLRR
jgi:hypothetical protein